MKNLKITVNGTAYDVQVEEMGDTVSASSSAPVAAPAPAVSKPVAAPAAKVQAPKAAASSAGAEMVSAPMPGSIVSVNVKPGQSVKKSDVLVILEAMKMENEIMAPHDGVVETVQVNKGDSVDTGAPLVSLQ